MQVNFLINEGDIFTNNQKIGRHIYEKDTVVIGGTLQALKFAFDNKLPVFILEPSPPFLFMDDQLNPDLDAWGELNIKLSIAGLSPGAGIIESSRIDNNTLILSTGRKPIRVSFKKAIIFDDANITGDLPDITRETILKSAIYDTFDVTSNVRTALKHYEREGDFVKHVYVHNKVDKKYRQQQLCRVYTISYVNPAEIDLFENSHTYVTFYLQDLFRGDPNFIMNKVVYRKKFVTLVSRNTFHTTKRKYKKDDRFEFRCA